MTWRPIASAPQDGTYIFAAIPSSPYVAEYFKRPVYAALVKWGQPDTGRIGPRPSDPHGWDPWPYQESPTLWIPVPPLQEEA